MRKFDLVTLLITLAGRIQEKRHAKLVAREAALKAAISAAQNALQATVNDRMQSLLRGGSIRATKRLVAPSKSVS